jgi:hypothetical protein
MRYLPFFILPILLAATLLPAETIIEAKSWWTQETYTPYPSTTLADLDLDLPRETVPLSRFGGNTAVRLEATGFFRTHFDGVKWIMVDPEGYEWFQIGCNSVRMNPSENGRNALKSRFGTPEQWARATIGQLRDLGFNLLANWSELPEGPDIPEMPYVVELGLMQEFGKSLGIAQMGYGHHKYEGEVMPVFHPGFPAFCRDWVATHCTDLKDDPWLLGYFSDNELPLTEDVLVKYLALPEGNVNRAATIHWLRNRNLPTDPEHITRELRLEFLEYIIRTYFRIVAEAIDTVDPNHLLLGCRFLGRDAHLPALWRGASEHVDVISLNLYGIWTPDRERMDTWARHGGKPFIITEWYSKGMDTGMPNKGGAGWIVKTQADRGRHYEHFTLALLRHPACVGWHWFKYMDNDPTDATADSSNRDANKGFVSNRYLPYEDLTRSMQAINTHVYWLRQERLITAP